MAQSQTNFLIRLNGEVSAGAGAIADKLNQIGSILEQVGSVTREFEEESVKIFQGYDDNMRATEVALSSKVSSATELQRQMTGLKQATQQWASSSIFHIDDVSAAVLNATRASWTYEETLKGIPAAMLIAQAGGMDLSTGLDFVAKMVKTTGISFDDLGTMIDQWAMAANSSATSIEEMGEAFMSLSASAMFADNTQELFTMIAALANAGVTGSQAGTLLRNAMMRMIAPTDKAKKAMQELGATEEDLADWKAAGATAEQLEELGFSAYNAKGELKPFKDILTSLHDSIAGLDEQGQYDILSTIFPLRSINAAMAFMNSIESGNFQQLYEAIGNSGGYAEYGANLMMGGITGAIETLKSKWEEFERKIGETLSPHIIDIAEGIGQIVNGLNEADPAQLEGITSVLSTLSVSGPILLGAAAVAKFASSLGLVGTLALAAAVGLSFAYGYLTKLDEMNFESKFGTLNLDVEKLSSYVDTVQSKFDIEQQSIEQYIEKAKLYQQQYNETLNSMSEGMLTKILRGDKFTQSDYDTFITLGEDMVKYTRQGITNAGNSDRSFLQAIFGDKSTKEEAQALNSASEVLDWYYSDLSSEAYQIGEGIRQKLTEALGNGDLTEQDREYIQAQIDRLNQIQAEIAAGMREQDYYKQLEKASRVSWDSISDFINDNKAKLGEEQESISDQYMDVIARVRAAFKRAREQGGDLTYTDYTGKKVTLSGSDLSEEREESVIQEIKREEQAARESAKSKYGEFTAKAFQALMHDSDFGDAWDFLSAVYAQNGGIPTDEFGYIDLSKLGLEGKSDGDIDKIRKQLLGLSQEGRLTSLAQGFEGYAGMDGILTMLNTAFTMAGEVGNYQAWKQRYAESGEDPFGLFTTDADKRIQERNTELTDKNWELEQAKSELRKLEAQSAEYQREISDSESYLNGESNGFYYDKDKVEQNLEGLYASKDDVDAEIEAAKLKVAELQSNVDKLNLQNAKDQFEKLGVTDQEGMESLVAKVGGEDGIDLMAEVDGDATQLHAAIMSEDGQTLMETIDGDASALEQELQKYEGKTIWVYLQGTNILKGQYAEGGRAVEPSIFGEAGAEWAIPERHDERTAELLNEARKASGFSWGDLISRYGGLNANANNQSVVLNYSPVINANDTTGVAGLLDADKDKLIKVIKKALDESMYRQSVEVFA